MHFQTIDTGDPHVAGRCRNYACKRKPITAGECWYCPACHERLEQQRNELLAACEAALPLVQLLGAKTNEPLNVIETIALMRAAIALATTPNP